MKATILAVACAATVTVIAGCSHNPAKEQQQPASNKDDGVFTYLLDRESRWTENKVETLPPLPGPANLLRFDVSQNTPLTFSVDAKSIAVGSDGVVRYTVVVTSRSGARNINYEGIRCDTYEWRQYAGLNADHSDWDRSVATRWRRIENGNLNAYQAALYQDYFCANKMPAASAQAIVENIRFGRTAASRIH